jgi:hypothetical protein
MKDNLKLFKLNMEDAQLSMIAGYFTLWVKSPTGINWLTSRALPEIGTALPQLVLFIFRIFINKLK